MTYRSMIRVMDAVDMNAKERDYMHNTVFPVDEEIASNKTNSNFSEESEKRRSLGGEREINRVKIRKDGVERKIDDNLRNCSNEHVFH